MEGCRLDGGHSRHFYISATDPPLLSLGWGYYTTCETLEEGQL